MTDFNFERKFGEDDAIFFGSPKGLHDTVVCHHPKLEQLFKAQKATDWMYGEFLLEKDREHMHSCPDSIRDLMLYIYCFSGTWTVLQQMGCSHCSLRSSRTQRQVSCLALMGKWNTSTLRHIPRSCGVVSQIVLNWKRTLSVSSRYESVLLRCLIISAHCRKWVVNTH